MSKLFNNNVGVVVYSWDDGVPPHHDVGAGPLGAEHYLRHEDSSINLNFFPNFFPWGCRAQEAMWWALTLSLGENGF